MALKPGARLGPYEISDPLGAGGMGEVYRARDTRLDRTVAIKVLPSHLSDNVQLRQRFEREARAVSGLNHPHICTLHDVGEQDGVHFLVMEHLEGETLAKRLERSALPQEEALRYAMEIADALDKAHRQGVVHRDLKPGNIMLTKGGAKLLDFGLAKSMDASPAVASLTAAPTGTSPLTAQGTIVGTFQYMAPEQFEGSEADVRSDIFSFGAVMYEMLTGKRAFEGKTQASVIAAIMRGEPRPLSDLVPMTPAALERLVLTCLAKDPDDRRQTIRGVLLELRWIAGGGAYTDSTTPARAGRAGLWMASTAVLAIAAAVLAWRLLAPAAEERRPMILSMTMPRASDDAAYFNQLAVSPAGHAAAFVMHGADGKRSLWVRDLDSTEARALPGTEAARNPFWSPDSRFIGFFAEGKLKKVDTAGGPPQVLCPSAGDSGGSWSENGVILFGDGEGGNIYKVPASGGAAEPVTQLGHKDEAHRWPAFLPDGKHFALMVDADRTEDHFLAIGSLDSAEVTSLFNMVSNVIFAPPGYLLFTRSGSLIAQPFDTNTLKPAGEPVALAGNVVGSIANGHRGEFSASSSGILTYRTADQDAHLAWVDPSGKPLETFGETARFRGLALSPDRSRVAYGKLDADGRTGDIWILDLARGVTSRVTFHPGSVGFPKWSPDGKTIVYSSAHENPAGGLYKTPADHPGEESPVTVPGRVCSPDDFTPDGRLLLMECLENGNWDLRITPLDDPAKARQLTSTPFDEGEARLSPDGRWISYDSDESGRGEVYVQDFPAMTKRILVSSGGGRFSEWRSDGKEIYYRDSLNRLNAVTLTYGGTAGIEASRPRTLFTLLGDSYVPDAGGRRFLVSLPAEDPRKAPVTVVLNWTHLLPAR